jgi:hypothetical protein
MNYDVQTNPAFADEVGSQAAGYLEGFLTALPIEQVCFEIR